MSKKSLGIIGGGFVGSAIANYYKSNGREVKVYDKFKDSDPVEEVVKQDYIFIAVPTPHKEDMGIDLEAMDDAMANASKAEKGKPVIIKSTIIPGTTDKYQKQYPDLKIMFNPEFLTERTAVQDFQFPDRQILGFTKESYNIAGDILKLLPLAPFERIIPAIEAETIKYFNNTWFAVKVTFANQFYDVCQKIGVDYNQVMECASADRRMTGTSHLKVDHDGYRGYGGKCLPKDVRAIISYADKLGVDMKLLKIAEEINKELTGGVDRGL